jgi:hypothetical protein
VIERIAERVRYGGRPSLGFVEGRTGIDQGDERSQSALAHGGGRAVVLLTFLLKISPIVAVPTFLTHCCSSNKIWRRSTESNGVFTDYQPQYPDLQGGFYAGFTGLQEVSDTYPPTTGINQPRTCGMHG